MELKSAITSEYFSILDNQFCDNLIDLYKEYLDHDEEMENVASQDPSFTLEREQLFSEKDNLIDVVNFNNDNELKLPSPIKPCTDTVRKDIIFNTPDNTIIQFNTPNTPDHVLETKIVVNKTPDNVKTEPIVTKAKENISGIISFPLSTESVFNLKLNNAGKLSDKENTSNNSQLLAKKSTFHNNKKDFNYSPSSTTVNQPIPNDSIPTSPSRGSRFEVLKINSKNHLYQQGLQNHIAFGNNNNKESSIISTSLNNKFDLWNYHSPRDFAPFNNKMSYFPLNNACFPTNFNHTIQSLQHKFGGYYYVPVITKNELQPIGSKAKSCLNYVIDSGKLIPLRNKRKILPRKCTVQKQNMLLSVPKFVCYPKNIETPKQCSKRQKKGTATTLLKPPKTVNTEIKRSIPPPNYVLQQKKESNKQFHQTTICTSYPCLTSEVSTSKHQQLDTYKQGDDSISSTSKTSVNLPLNFGKDIQNLYDTSALDNFFSNVEFQNEDDIVADFLSSYDHNNATIATSDNDLKAIESLKEKLICEVSPFNYYSTTLNNGMYSINNAVSGMKKDDNVQKEKENISVPQGSTNVVSLSMVKKTEQSNYTPTYLNKSCHKEMVGLRETIQDSLEASSSTDSDDYGLYLVRKHIMRENPTSKHNMNMRKRFFSSMASDDCVNIPAFGKTNHKKNSAPVLPRKKKMRKTPIRKEKKQEPEEKTKVSRSVCKELKQGPEKNIKATEPTRQEIEEVSNLKNTQFSRLENKQETCSKTVRANSDRKSKLKIKVKIPAEIEEIIKNGNKSSLKEEVPGNELFIQIGDTKSHIGIKDELYINIIEEKACESIATYDNNLDVASPESIISTIANFRRLNDNELQMDDKRLKKASSTTAISTSSPKSSLIASPIFEKIQRADLIKEMESLSPVKLEDEYPKYRNKVRVIVKPRCSSRYSTRVRLGSDGMVEGARNYPKVKVQKNLVDGEISEEYKDFLYFIKSNKLLDTNVSYF